MAGDPLEHHGKDEILSVSGGERKLWLRRALLALPWIELLCSQCVGGTWRGVRQGGPHSPRLALLLPSPLRSPAPHL